MIKLNILFSSFRNSKSVRFEDKNLQIFREKYFSNWKLIAENVVCDFKIHIYTYYISAKGL